VRLERNTPTEVALSVGDLPSDLHYVPTLTVRAYGRSEGLSHWIVARDGNQGRHCTAEPRDADHGCLRPVDVTSHSTVSIWLEGAVAGQYTIELALWDYRGEETLFEDPVCTKEIVVDVK
jgi:hypothetical protein